MKYEKTEAEKLCDRLIVVFGALSIISFFAVLLGF